jgi:hypothetical protein
VLSLVASETPELSHATPGSPPEYVQFGTVRFGRTVYTESS